MEYLLPVAIIAALIFFNGLFVAVEFAVVASSRARMSQLATAGSSSAAKVMRVLTDPTGQTRFIIMAQLGITLSSLGLGMYGEHTIAEWILSLLEHYGVERGLISVAAAHSAALVLAIAVMTYLHVVLGEVMPKSLALQAPESTALRVIGPVWLIERVFSPAIFVLNVIARAITRACGVPERSAHDHMVSPQDLEMIVEESSEEGLIAPSEQLYIENILDMRERTVGQVMTPRTRIEGISVDESERAILQLVRQSNHSRYPIYDGDLDQIRGFFHIKDLARHLQRGADGGPLDLRKMAQSRPVIVVPETLSLDQMLGRFRAEKGALAVVIDEFGGTAGIVTFEDLMEEVVGEIQDEFDAERAPFEIVSERRLRVDGSLLLDELNQHFGIDYDEEEVDTVGGLIMSRLGRIPAVGDVVELNGVRYVVEQVAGRAVDSVLVELPEASPDPADPENGDV
ncbi:MAG: hemolysin family protein [Caldilineaceae bacterium]|nr:hemolysin family protein [Caldilineaceae bacterium]